MTGDEKAKLAGVVAPPRGDRADLAADVERERSGGEPARNSQQTGKRRGIGWLGSWITLGCWKSDGIRLGSLLGFILGSNSAKPNDPKLSDGGAWRGSCVVRRRRDIRATKMERTDETGPGQK